MDFLNFLEYVVCFFIYSFLGYICEVVYCSIGQRKLRNRGYLYLPFCPIYGFGAIFILLAMLPIRNLWYVVLIAGILLTSTLEYLTSYLMERIFHMRWWDYSLRKFNIHGRICLRNSLMFGGLVMLVIYGIQPVLLKGIRMILPIWMWVIVSILALAMLIDFIFSTIKNINISSLVVKLAVVKEEAGMKLLEMKEDATEKLNELKQEASTKINETKEFLNHTIVVQNLRKMVQKYPSVTLRKFGKKHESIEELLKDYQEVGDEIEHH